jgi:hypothetical protein
VSARGPRLFTADPKPVRVAVLTALATPMGGEQLRLAVPLKLTSGITRATVWLSREGLIAKGERCGHGYYWSRTEKGTAWLAEAAPTASKAA